jgi:hypothetical protein
VATLNRKLKAFGANQETAETARFRSLESTESRSLKILRSGRRRVQGSQDSGTLPFGRAMEIRTLRHGRRGARTARFTCARCLIELQGSKALRRDRKEGARVGRSRRFRFGESRSLKNFVAQPNENTGAARSECSPISVELRRQNSAGRAKRCVNRKAHVRSMFD